MGLVTRLYGHYKAYHEYGTLLLRYFSLLGLIGIPLLYSVRYLRSSAGYDDLHLRIVNVTLCLLLLLRERWPVRLKPYYLPYSYLVVLITLPVTFIFTSLKNGGGPAAVGNTFFAAFLVMLLADWRNMIVMLVSGAAIAGTMYGLTDPNAKLPMEYLARLPVLVAGLVGGSLFKHALEQATAERVRQAYASLAGSIAHEMRNPMAQVRHSLENIRQSLPLPSLRSQSQWVEGEAVDALYRHVAQGELAVRRGLQVIEMTLDQVNAKPMDPGKLEVLSAADVCGKAIEEYGYENAQQRESVSLVVRRDFLFRGDETAFLFVLFNLLKNALYYLPAYPNARLALTVDAGVVRVRDTGPGIAPEQLARLFEPFRTSGKTGGTGLGLSYCRRVLESLGGHIECASEQGVYTEFSLHLTALTPQEVETQRSADLAEASKRMAGRRVLVVDDDAGVRASTRMKLLGAGCLVTEASDGFEAQRELRNERFDALVLDINMPRMDGYALAEALRGDVGAANQHICILAHTSEPSHVVRVKMENAGVDGYVGKPCDQLVLLRALSRAMDASVRKVAHRTGWLAGRRVLLADDNAYNRAAVGAYLRHAGMLVTEVGGGLAVLRELRQSDHFDAVVLDLHMPGLDGVQTARALRGLGGRCEAVPILGVTAHASPDHMAQARTAGIADFLTKPVDPDLLYGRLASLLGLDAPRQPVQSPRTEPPHPGGLLDEGRLEGYRRIGMLDELLEEYGPEIDRLVDRLDAAAGRGDLQATLDVLHSLVGMSGEAGAAALHRYVREVYVPMLERQAWPSGDGWVPRIRELAVETSQALRLWADATRDASV